MVAMAPWKRYLHLEPIPVYACFLSQIDGLTLASSLI